VLSKNQGGQTPSQRLEASNSDGLARGSRDGVEMDGRDLNSETDREVKQYFEMVEVKKLVDKRGTDLTVPHRNHSRMN